MVAWNMTPLSGHNTQNLIQSYSLSNGQQTCNFWHRNKVTHAACPRQYVGVLPGVVGLSNRNSSDVQPQGQRDIPHLPPLAQHTPEVAASLDTVLFIIMLLLICKYPSGPWQRQVGPAYVHISDLSQKFQRFAEFDFERLITILLAN